MMGLPQRADKEAAFMQLKAHVLILSAWVTAIRVAPYVLQAISGTPSE